jgi:hypothetical protein
MTSESPEIREVDTKILPSHPQYVLSATFDCPAALPDVIAIAMQSRTVHVKLLFSCAVCGARTFATVPSVPRSFRTFWDDNWRVGLGQLGKLRNHFELLFASQSGCSLFLHCSRLLRFCILFPCTRIESQTEYFCQMSKRVLVCEWIQSWNRSRDNVWKVMNKQHYALSGRGVRWI